VSSRHPDPSTSGRQHRTIDRLYHIAATWSRPRRADPILRPRLPGVGEDDAHSPPRYVMSVPADFKADADAIALARSVALRQRTSSFTENARPLEIDGTVARLNVGELHNLSPGSCSCDGFRHRLLFPTSRCCRPQCFPRGIFNQSFATVVRAGRLVLFPARGLLLASSRSWTTTGQRFIGERATQLRTLARPPRASSGYRESTCSKSSCTTTIRAFHLRAAHAAPMVLPVRRRGVSRSPDPPIQLNSKITRVLSNSLVFIADRSRT